MALKTRSNARLVLKSEAKSDDKTKPKTKEEGPNDHLGEEPIDAPVGYGPRIVQVPMNQNSDVNPEVHADKMEKKKQRAASESKVMIKKGAVAEYGVSPALTIAGQTNAPKAAPAQQTSSTNTQTTKPAALPAAPKTPAPAPVAPSTPPKPMSVAPMAQANAQSNSALRMMKAEPNVELLMKGGKGPGSRGGKIAYHTAKGKPVYQSQVKKHAESAEKMMQNWHAHADRHLNSPYRGQKEDPEHHAIAAKQALHAAFYHHHAGDEAAASQAMDYATHHRAKYERAGHSSRTTTAVAKLHGETANTVGHGHWQPKEHGLSDEHVMAHDADLEKKHKEAKKIRDEAHEKVKHAAAILGHTRSGHEVHAISESHQKAMEGYNKHNFSDITPEEHASHRKAKEQHHAKHGSYAGWSKEDHNDAQRIYSDHQTKLQNEGAHTQSHPVQAYRGLQHDHSSYADIRGEYQHSQVEGGQKVADQKIHNIIHGKNVKKAITPSNSIGGNMSTKNEVADLFKSELGASNAKFTTCVHCKHELTKADLVKGLGTSFVADDNDNPSSGGSGQVEASRGVPGVKENDEIAPLLKGLKDDEYPISKSEMLTMGMNADDLKDGWYKISKSEVMKQAPEHLAYLIERKDRVSKSTKPVVDEIKKSTEASTIRKSDSTRSTTDGPHGYSPRAGGVHGPGGEQLVQWSQGSDKEVAKFIEKSGGYGPGTDESIRTEGRGY